MAELNNITKVCTKCNEEKSLFRKAPRGKDGYRTDCRDCELKYKKEYREKNKEKIAIDYKRWATENSEFKNKINTDYHNKKYNVDYLFTITKRIRNLISHGFRNKWHRKNTKTEKILGCTFEEFKEHIEKQFVDGMSWENVTKWHLDHIYPISLAKSEEEVIKLNHYTNFQPLWAKDNIRKSNKLNYGKDNNIGGNNGN